MLCKTLLSAGLILGCASAWAGTDHTVMVAPGGVLQFDPADLSITAGDTVTFVNDNGGFHNVASDPGSVTPFRCANGCDATGGNGNVAGPSWTATVTFPAAGEVTYHCDAHPGQMIGAIHVTVPVDLQSYEID